MRSICIPQANAMHCLLVTVIITTALKRKQINLLAQFLTKYNKFFIKFWGYLDTNSTMIYIKFCSLKNEENGIFFPKTVAKNFKD